MLPIRPLTYQDSSIETETCVGPRYTRTQPSRETPGVLLDDKYIVEFNLPYRNLVRYVKEVEKDWSKLTDEQKQIINDSYQRMGMKRSTPARTLAQTNQTQETSWWFWPLIVFMFLLCFGFGFFLGSR